MKKTFQSTKKQSSVYKILASFASICLIANSFALSLLEFTETISSDSSFSKSTAIGDIDGDNDLDIYVGNDYSQQNFLLINDGTGKFTKKTITGDTGNTRNVIMADFNNDGKLDLYAVNYNQQNNLWIQNSDNTFSAKNILNDIGTSEKATVGDIDGDNDLDIYLTFYSAANKLWINDGNANFTENTVIPNVGGNSIHAAMVDTNNDNKLDIYVGTDLLINQGDTNSDGQIEFLTSSFLNDRDESTYILTGDFNNDNQTDIYKGIFQKNNILWLSDGNGDYVLNELTDDVGAVSGGAVVDIDGDNDLDIFVINIYGNKLWLNDGSGNFSTIPDGNFYYGLSGVLGDLDGDNDIDIFITNNKDNSLIFNNNKPTDITISSNAIKENEPANTIIGTLSTTDSNPQDVHSYSLIADEVDNSLFEITGTQLKSREKFDFETKNTYTVKIQTDDNKGGVFIKELNINIENVNGIAVNNPDDLQAYSKTISAIFEATNEFIEQKFAKISSDQTCNSNISNFNDYTDPIRLEGMENNGLKICFYGKTSDDSEFFSESNIIQGLIMEPISTCGKTSFAGSPRNLFSTVFDSFHSSAEKNNEPSKQISEQESREQLAILNKGFLGKVLTYVNNNGIEVFRGYQSGKKLILNLRKSARRNAPVQKAEELYHSDSIKKFAKKPTPRATYRTQFPSIQTLASQTILNRKAKTKKFVNENAIFRASASKKENSRKNSLQIITRAESNTALLLKFKGTEKTINFRNIFTK